jgi:hypothetical protein
VTVEVRPATFSMVSFDAAEIAAIVDRLADQLGLGDVDVVVEVDETTPLGRARVTSIDPVVLAVESGALEDPKRPRQMGVDDASDVLGRLLLRVRDRLDPAFGDVPGDDELSLPVSVAWDVYCVGRLSRLGYRAQRQRRLYHFRNRHGFTDSADAAFDHLWNAESLSWAEIESTSADAAAAQPA